MHKFLTTALVATIFLLIIGCSKTPENKVEDYYQKGLAEIEKMDLEKARISFGKIGEIDSNSVLMTYGLALTDEREFFVYDALNAYMNIIRIKPDHKPALEGIVRIYTMLDQPREALQAAREYANVYADDFKSQLTLTKTLLQNNLYDLALIQLDKLQKSSDEKGLLDFVRARIFFMQNRFDSAETYLAKALADPVDKSEYYIEGAGYFETVGLIDSAMVFSRKLWELAPDDFDVIITHFFRTLRTNYFFETEKIIKHLDNKSGSFPLNAGLNNYYMLAQGNTVQAKRICVDLRDDYGDKFTTLFLNLEAEGRSQDIMEFNSLVMAVERRFEIGNYGENFQLFIIYLTDLASSGTQDDFGTLKRFELLSEEYANRKEVVLKKAYHYNHSGKFEEFDQTMTTLAKDHSNDANWLMGLGDVYGMPGIRKYDKAEKHYRLALKADELYFPVFKKLLEFYKNRRQLAKALKLYDEFPHFEKRFPEAGLLKSFYLVEKDQVAEGMNLFKDKIGYMKGDMTCFSRLFDILEKKYLFDEKKKVVTWLQELCPDNHHALLMAAEEEENHTEVLRLAEIVLAKDPENIKARIQKARAWYWTGKRDEAFEIFEEVLGKDKTNIDANYYFSKILAYEQTDINRAVNLARRAIFNSDKSLKYFLNLIYVYNQGNKSHLAKGEAKKAISSFPFNPEPYFEYGMILYNEGNNEAKKNLQRAVDLGLKGANLKKAKETLNKF